MSIDIFLYMILRPLATEPSHYLNKHLAAFATAHKHHFTVKQCEALEIALDIIKVTQPFSNSIINVHCQLSGRHFS